MGHRRRRNRERSKSRGFYRSEDSVFLGVCAGIAEYFDFAPWGVRLLFLILQFTFAPYLIVAYIVLAIVMKKRPVEIEERHFRNYEDEEFYNSYEASRAEALKKAKNAFDALDKRLQRMESVVTDRRFNLEDEYRNL